MGVMDGADQVKDPGGFKPKVKVKGPPVDYKFPPKRTPAEWRQLTAMKLRQFEMIAWDFKKSGGTGGE